jgi:hypothetical protein
MRIFLITLIVISFLHAAENFSEMSTQELIAIMGYVKKPDEPKFKKELKSRVPSMNSTEKKKYEANLVKLK